MVKERFSSVKITSNQASDIAKTFYKIEGKISPLNGWEDFNFKIETESGSFVLKVSRPDENIEYVKYQYKILDYISNNTVQIISPKVFPNINGEFLSQYTDKNGNLRIVRLLSWIDGLLWTNIDSIDDNLLFSLGQQAGKLTNALQGFDHNQAHRKFGWDLAQADWTFEHLSIFSDEKKEIIKYFQENFKVFQNGYKNLRKSVVHNDVNNNNVIVYDNENPKVKAVIDYGDAMYTPIINDLAITIAYGVMESDDYLSDVIQIIKGYHDQFPLLKEEMNYLFDLVAMRLVVIVTNAAVNHIKEPDNKYLFVTEKPAWKVLNRWFLYEKVTVTRHFIDCLKSI
jgi:Ser/Thr protein kinase RdoA (MazF antagonist)